MTSGNGILFSFGDEGAGATWSLLSGVIAVVGRGEDLTFTHISVLLEPLLVSVKNSTAAFVDVSFLLQ